MNFASLDLPGPGMQGIREAGFVTATPIQEAALPLALRGKDVAGKSQTGTGKTAAFLIAAFPKMLRTPAPPPPPGAGAPRMLVIAPTRELVVQIESDARQLGRFTPFRTLAVYGGIDYAKQRETLAAGCDLLVGTPGRLIDYLKQHVWTPRRVEILVIDEADRMFDMGFIADLRFILRRLPTPERRQSFLFSATLSFRVLELTWEFMNNPSQITIMPQQKTAERVEQMLYHVGREDKFPLLLGLMRPEGDRFLLFSNTREEARRLEDRLIPSGRECGAQEGRGGYAEAGRRRRDAGGGADRRRGGGGGGGGAGARPAERPRQHIAPEPPRHETPRPDGPPAAHAPGVAANPNGRRRR